jgi:hypothetical protein
VFSAGVPFLGFDVDPAADNTTTGEYQSVRAFAVDNSEFHIAINRRRIYRLPLHVTMIHNSPTGIVDLDQCVD